MASVYPSTQWGEIKRFELPMFAASDIIAGTIVRVASSGDLAVQMVLSSAEQPLGIARDNAKAGEAVSVFDDGNVKRILAGASFTRQAQIGYVGTSQTTHPESGVTVTYPYAGQVTGTPSVAVGASTTAVWSLGQAVESAAIGDMAAVRVSPRLLSGLS